MRSRGAAAQRCCRARALRGVVAAGIVGLGSIAPGSAARAAEEAVPPAAPPAEPALPAAPPAGPTLEALTFDQAVERALARNPTARTAQQEIARAEALLWQSRAPALPSLTASAVNTRLDEPRKSTIPPTPANPQGTTTVVQPANVLSANVSLGLPLVAASRWAQWSHAAENVDVSRLNAADVQRLLALNAGRAWLTVLAQHRVVEANDRAFRTAQAHYDFAHGRRSGGVGTRLDEVRADQEVQATAASLESAQTALTRAREALGVLVGTNVPVDVAGQPELAAIPTVDQALREANEQRADVRALRARREAAAHVARDSWLDYLPTVSAQATPFYNHPGTLTNPANGWTAQLVLTLPLFDGLLRPGQARERGALATEAALAVEAGERQANSEVRTAAEVIQRADAALASTRRSALLAHEALDLANQAYRAGASTNLDVLDAERRALDADTSVAVAEDASRQARLDLLAASGRFPGGAAR